ncbi:MAG: hypothetical protein ACRDP2_18145 [Nocardioidaceae bacterium]
MAPDVTQDGDQTEVVRWYTHARRFPILIGKAGMNGDPLPGGPYTSTQVVAWFGTLAGLYFTRDMWGQFGDFMNAVVLLGVPIAVGWAARWIPHDARNPVLIAAGWVRCFGAPPAGRVDGLPVRQRSPYRLRHQFVVDPRSYAATSSSAEIARLSPRSWPSTLAGDAAGGEDAQSRREGDDLRLTDVQALLANRR